MNIRLQRSLSRSLTDDNDIMQTN